MNTVKVLRVKNGKTGMACSMHWEMRSAYKILVGKPWGMKPLGRDGHNWEDNIKTNFRRTGCESVDQMKVAQDEVQ
jgi:hypothetical protein